MTQLAIRPSVYYNAATTLHNAATSLFNEVDGRWQALSAGAHMAGTYEEARKWADSYDAKVLEVSDLVVNTAMTLDSYAGTLRELGHRHEVAEYESTMGAGGDPPAPPPAPPPAVYTCRVPIPSAGGPGNGLEDGGVKLAEKIGITVPNGDTAKLEAVGDVWAQMAKATAVTALPADIVRVMDTFTDAIVSPEVDLIAADLAKLRTAAEAVGSTFATLSKACRDHAAALHDLRQKLRAQLEELGKELAKELVITAAIGVAASLVTFGIGAAVASARVATIAARFATPIRALIDMWKSERKIQNFAHFEHDLSAVQKSLQQVEKVGGDVAHAPKPPAAVRPANWTAKDDEGIIDYIEDGRRMNERIREGNVSDAIAFRTERTTEALDKLPNHEGWVSRRISSEDMPPEVLEQYQKGNVVTEDAFTSSSRAEGGTPFSGDVEMHIYSKTGKDVSAWAPEHMAREQEVLFKPQTSFNVLNRYVDPETGRTVIIAEEL